MMSQNCSGLNRNVIKVSKQIKIHLFLTRGFPTSLLLNTFLVSLVQLQWRYFLPGLDRKSDGGTIVRNDGPVRPKLKC